MSLPHEEIGEEDLEDPTFGDTTDVNQQTGCPITSISPWLVEIMLETRIPHLIKKTSVGSWNQQSKDQAR